MVDATRLCVPGRELAALGRGGVSPAMLGHRRRCDGAKRTHPRGPPRGPFGCGSGPDRSDRATERARSWHQPSRPRPLHCLVFRGPVGSPFHAMSYAIINVGGKQYVVHEGEKLLVDRLATEPGETFTPTVLFL